MRLKGPEDHVAATQGPEWPATTQDQGSWRKGMAAFVRKGTRVRASRVQAIRAHLHTYVASDPSLLLAFPCLALLRWYCLAVLGSTSSTLVGNQLRSIEGGAPNKARKSGATVFHHFVRTWPLEADVWTSSGATGAVTRC